MVTIPRVVIAGLRGGSGKTTLSLGLLADLRKKKRRIVPFKKGPDYIDAGWLGRAAGRECHNLDAFLFPEGTVLRSFAEAAAQGDGALIEGNRGLFDGVDERGTFSTARLAKLLSAPVVLIVDCSKATTTVAALVKGVVGFDPRLMVKGVVLNRVAGPRHEAVIRRAVGEHTDVRVVGAIGRLADDILLERHMGLVPHHEARKVSTVLGRIGRIIADCLDLHAIEEIMRSAPPLDAPRPSPSRPADAARTDRVRIGVLRDRAFQFYYPENLRALEDRGARIIEIDALASAGLPPVDALYIGGGFPETQAVGLSRNRSLLSDIRRRAEQGLPVYAECGGLMFLGRRIRTGGRWRAMVGLLPLEFSMHERPVAHGYTMVSVTGENPFFPVGTELRGHEFHYSEVIGSGRGSMSFTMLRGSGIRGGRDGITYKNVLATYTHVHALGCPEWADGMVTAAAKHRDR